MAAQPYWISSLLLSYSPTIVSRLGSDRTFTFHFLDAAPSSWTNNNTGFTPFNEAQRAFTRELFSYFSTIIDVKFVESSTYSSSNTIVLGNNDQGGSGSAGYATDGGGTWGLFMSNVHSLASAIADPKNNPSVINIYIHEIGHILGLKHPFGNTMPILSDAEDNFDLTIMTYGSKSPGIPAPQSILLQPLDIAALQYLYGPSKTAANASRSDTYTLDPNGRNFIWDGGGTDKLDASASSKRLVLDLEPLTQGYFGTAPSNLISANGQITVNFGTVIEQIAATGYDDILYGNAADNVFWTNGGVDYVDGRAGNDTIVVNSAYAANQLYLEGQQLVVAVNAGSVTRLQDVETVRYTDGDRSVATLKQSAAIVPFATVSNSPTATITGSVALNYEFSETVTGLTASDFIISGGQVVSVNGTGKSYTVTVAPAERTTGVLSIQLSGGAVTGASGATNLVSQSQYFNVDTQSIALVTTGDAATATNGTIVLKFDDTFTLGAGDIVIQSSSGAEIERLSKNDAERVFQKGSVLYLDLKSQVADGATLKVSIPAGVILDQSGNTVAYSVTASANRIVETLGTSGADTRNLGPLSDIYRGLEGDDRIWGEEGEDLIDGGPGNDRLNGMQGDDTLLGGDGDDTLIGGTGDDKIDGGAGTDTVEYGGINSTQATITKTADGYTVSTAAEGTDKLTNVELLKFSDKIVTLDAGPDTTAPSLNSANPRDGGDIAPVSANLTLYFSEAIQKGSGTIQLRLGSANGQVIESFDIATSSRLAISGSTLTVDPTANLVANERYFLVLPAGAFKDAAGNLTTLIDTYDFVAKDADIAWPNIVNVSPARNATGINPSSNIVITFDEDIILTPREILQLRKSDGTVVETFTQGTSTRLTVSGKTLTIDPTNDLEPNVTYTIAVASGWVRDAAGNGTPGSEGYVRFTTASTSGTNNAPTFAASSQSASTNEDAARTITVSATDADGDALTYTVSAPAKGTASVVGNVVTYTPSKDYNGSDSFIVNASDGKGGTATQTINLTVTAVNDAPTFSNSSQSVSATAGTAKTITLTATDVDGDTITYTVATPGKGTAAIAGSTLTYTPANSASGTDSFVVTATDGKGGSANQSINVTITAQSSNRAPTFSGLTGAAQEWLYDGHYYGLYTTAKSYAAATTAAQSLGGYLLHINSAAEQADVFSKVSSYLATSLANTRAPDGGNAAYIWLGASDAAVEGTWVWADDNSTLSSGYSRWGAGALGSEPDNSGNQDYLALGLENWPQGSATNAGYGNAGYWNDISVNNSLYYVVEKSAALSLATNEDVSKSFTISASDADNDALTYTVSSPTKGIATVVGNVVTYTPSKDYNGADSFTVTATDGKGGTATQTINVTVTAVNDAPTFSTSSQSVSATAGAAQTITLAATDVDRDALTYTTTTPSKGSATISGSTLTYTPTSSATGTDSFTVTASDGKGGNATQTISVTISAATTTATQTFRLVAPDGWVGSVGGNGNVVGTSGFQDVRITSGSVSLDGSFNTGNDVVRLDGNGNGYSIVRSGSSATISKGSSASLTVPIGTTGAPIVFDDGPRKLVFSNSNFNFGSQTFSTTQNAITAGSDGTALPTGASASAVATAILAGTSLSSGQTSHISIGGTAKIVGTTVNEVVQVISSAKSNLTFDPSFNQGGDVIVFGRDAGSFTAQRSSSSMLLVGPNENLTIPIGTAGLTLRFTDGDRTLIFSNGEFKIGTQSIGTTAIQLTGSTTTTSIDAGTAASQVTLNASTGAVNFTDNAAVETNVRITGFGADDRITVTGATSSRYSFTTVNTDGNSTADLVITFNNVSASAVNSITLVEAVSANAFVADYATAQAAIGNAGFMVFG